MPIYPYSFQLPPLNVQDIPNDGAPGEFLGINVGGALDWLPAGGGGGSGDMLAANNLSELTNFATARTNIGLGTSSTPTFANLTLTSPSLSSSAPVTISQTWGTTGTYTAFKVVANETATADAASNLLELWSGNAATLKVSITKIGVINCAGVTSLGLIIADANRAALRDGGVTIGNAGAVQWSASATAGSSRDLFLLKDAANTLALRNGGNAQTFNVYGTYTSLTDYKRLSLSCSATTGNATIGVPFNSVLAVTGGSATATVATVNFAPQAAAFPLGSTVTVTGVTPAGYNATAVVIASTTTSVSYASTVNAAYVSGGTATVSGSAALTLTSAGNVGIGTTAPVAKLEVVGGNSQILLDVKNGEQSAFRVFTSSGLGNIRFTHSNSPLLSLIQSTGNTIDLRVGSNNLQARNTSALPMDLIIQGDGGNVGIGTTAPVAKLEIVATAATGVRESILRASVSDNATSAFHIYNATAGDNKFVPGFSGSVFDNTSPASLFFTGITDVTNDTGAFPLINFATRTTTSTADPNNGTVGFIINRPLFAWTNATSTLMQMAANGNLGIGTTLPTSKLHVAGSSSPSITVDNTVNTGASQLLFKNTVVTGDTDGIFLNGSTQTGFGGAGSLNIKATTGPIAFHTASVANALSIAQSGAATFIGIVSSISSISANVGSYIMWGNGASSRMLAPSNGSIQFTDAATTGFNLLQFGGASASFPAIKRSTVRIQAVLANDSGFTNIQGKLTTDTDYTATVVTPTGFLTLYDAQGTAYRVPCVLAP